MAQTLWTHSIWHDTKVSMQDRCVYWIDCAAVAIKEGFTFVHSVLPSRDIIGDIAKKIEKTVGP